MNKNDFFFLLLGASYASFKFAQSLVTDNLPFEFRYNVYLNSSLDDLTQKKFDTYPEDDEKQLLQLTDKEVVNELCRNGQVPVWIDLTVESTTNEFTIFGLLCAGRYSADRNEYYYEGRGSGPFGLKGPNLPAGYTDGVKFKLGAKNVA